MTKEFCDKCGEELNSNYNSIMMQISYLDTAKKEQNEKTEYIDLCDKCFKEFKKYIKI